MSKFSIESALAAGALAGALLSGCDMSPGPTRVPQARPARPGIGQALPTPTELVDPNIVSNTTCVGVARGEGTNAIRRALYRATSRDPSRQPFSPNQPMTIHSNPDGLAIEFRINHTTYGGLDDVSLTAPGPEGVATTAVCMGTDASEDSFKVFDQLADQAGISPVPEVCTKIRPGDTPIVAMERALNKAGNDERYNAFMTSDLNGNRRPPMLAGDVRAGAYSSTIYAGSDACAANWRSEQRETHK